VFPAGKLRHMALTIVAHAALGFQPLSGLPDALLRIARPLSGDQPRRRMLPSGLPLTGFGQSSGDV